MSEPRTFSYMTSVTLNLEQVGRQVHVPVSCHPMGRATDMKVAGSTLALGHVTSVCFPCQMEINVVKKRHRTRSKGVRGRCGADGGGLVRRWSVDPPVCVCSCCGGCDPGALQVGEASFWATAGSSSSVLYVLIYQISSSLYHAAAF